MALLLFSCKSFPYLHHRLGCTSYVHVLNFHFLFQFEIRTCWILFSILFILPLHRFILALPPSISPKPSRHPFLLALPPPYVKYVYKLLQNNFTPTFGFQGTVGANNFESLFWLRAWNWCFRLVSMLLYEHIWSLNILGLVDNDYRFVIKCYLRIYLWSSGYTTLKTK